MARTRSIKPSFFTNEVLAELPPMTRLLFVGLWCLADREGRLEDRPKRIKAALFPFEDAPVDDALRQLADFGFLVRYQIDEMRIIQIANFKKHQFPHKTERASELPSITVKQPLDNGSSPPVLLLNCLSVNLDSCSEPQADSEHPSILSFPTRGKGIAWHLTEAKIAEYATTYPGLDVLAECRRARQWCVDNRERRKTPQGMPAFLSRWLAKACDRPAVKQATNDKANVKALNSETEARKRQADEARAKADAERLASRKLWAGLQPDDQAARVAAVRNEKAYRNLPENLVQDEAISRYALQQRKAN